VDPGTKPMRSGEEVPQKVKLFDCISRSFRNLLRILSVIISTKTLRIVKCKGEGDAVRLIRHHGTLSADSVAYSLLQIRLNILNTKFTNINIKLCDTHNSDHTQHCTSKLTE